ncbi:LuxR C-terminal-related transcriptional regulator [Amycolatopsis sp. EV170708-02-1]|uniref:helix-turn-helix transcriptional regulator n=1 Tax=Amycolatopsis sp. EV170708-02-1 TaxID=2919322 RepID=UPI001F0C7305|nr:LuxR C-terminal-related transcriptional regulator [Amycolatopsis sp. EV170708-02-1]UMP03328.1 LuxR C-terminal-related transcriptional regulator [Amycolatopsis sp. EV170708-02-1]
MSLAKYSGGSGRVPAESTTFVGRKTELLRLSETFRSGPMVTLTGPGGVGKSRLAAHFATSEQAGFADGAYFVALADLNEPALLASTVAEALGLTDRSARPAVELLAEWLRDRHALLVLDNCEHLADGCARLAGTLLARCPGLAILATSRHPLKSADEKVLPVPPLAVPRPRMGLRELLAVDAVRLFADRASAVLPSFEISESNAEDVARLCECLEGVPLAIELAAVRIRALSVRQITERLDKQLALLTTSATRHGPERHGTLRAMIDWSHQLCSGPERLLWARASVFSGGFEADAAAAVCSDAGLTAEQTLELIDSLVEKSILIRDERDDVVWYRLLETIRQYGHEKLAAAGDVARMRRRHSEWYLALGRQCGQAWIGPDQLSWSRRLHREHANLRAALDFCGENPDDAVDGMSMAFQIKEFWLIHGLTSEGRLHLGKLLDAARPDAPGRANALLTYTFLALIQGDRPAYETALEQTAQAAEQERDDSVKAYLLLVRGYDALTADRMAEASDLFARSGARQHELDDLSGELWARFNHGISTGLSGDLDHGRRILRECVAEYASRGEIFWRSWALWSLGATEYLVGDLEKARDACRETLQLEQEVQDKAILAFVLTVSAGVAARTGQHRRAATVFGAATAMWATIGMSPARYAAFTDPIQKDTETVTTQLGLDAAAAAFTRGYTMPTHESIAYTLADESPSPHTGARHPLTTRETEVANLVAQGMTNRQIAETLSISRRTASTHVDHIMTKLNFTNRTQIATWVITDAPG